MVPKGDSRHAPKSCLINLKSSFKLNSQGNVKCVNYMEILHNRGGEYGNTIRSVKFPFPLGLSLTWPLHVYCLTALSPDALFMYV